MPNRMQQCSPLVDLETFDLPVDCNLKFLFWRILLFPQHGLQITVIYLYVMLNPQLSFSS